MKTKLLIIEDDPFTQQFYQILFQRANFDPYITDNGDDMFSILSDNEIALIVLDVNLKNTLYKNQKVNGIDIAKMIRAVEAWEKIPILLVTAYHLEKGKPNFVEECKATDYVIKPIVDFNKFLEKINELILNGKG